MDDPIKRDLIIAGLLGGIGSLVTGFSLLIRSSNSAPTGFYVGMLFLVAGIYFTIVVFTNL